MVFIKLVVLYGLWLKVIPCARHRMNKARQICSYESSGIVILAFLEGMPSIKIHNTL